MKRMGLLYRMRRRLVAWLDPGPPEPPAPQPIAPQSSPPTDFDRKFVDQLKSLLDQRSHTELLSGRIKVIGLQAIKEKLGAAWDRVANRADQIARTVIERHLDRNDIYTGLKSETYVVVFAHLSPIQARAKCILIRNEITKALLAEDGTRLLQVQASVGKVDRSLDLRPVASADQIVDSLAGGPDIEFADIEDPQQAKAPVVGRPRHALPDVIAGMQFAYRPLWDQGRNAISAYHCVTQLPTAGSAVGDDAMLEHVMDDLQDILREKRVLLLTLSVHFETLASTAQRRRYLDALMRRLGSEGGKYLMMEIKGLPPGVQQSRLAELVKALRSLCRGVKVRVPFETVDFGHVRETGVTAVGCDISSYKGTEVALMQQMNRFNRGAVGAGAPTYLHGADTLSQVAAAVGAGFTYIGGDSVAKLVDHPRTIVQLHLADLYRASINA